MRLHKQQTAKDAWGELQRKANEGFGRGFMAALSCAVASGYITEHDARMVMAIGEGMNPDEHAQSLTLLREEGKK
jgi:hypothetical protein